MAGAKILYHRESSGWKGRALGAFAVAAALGMAGWYAEKWWDHPIEHEGIKLATDSVRIGSTVVNNPFSFIKAKVPGADQTQKSIPAPQAPEVDASDDKLSNDNKLRNCEFDRIGLEHYNNYNAEQEDQYRKYSEMSRISRKVYTSMMGYDQKQYAYALALQAQAAMRQLWEKQKDPSLNPLDRYVILGNLLEAAAAARGSVYFDNNVLKPYRIFSESDVENNTGVSLSIAYSPRGGLFLPALRQMVSEVMASPADMDPNSEEAKRLSALSLSLGIDFWQDKEEIGLSGDEAKEVSRRLTKIRNSVFSREYAYTRQDYACAGIPAPGMKP